MKSERAKNTITDDVVLYVAKLSRLSFEEKDVPKFREQLSGILGYIEQLKEVDTEDTLPTTHVLSSMKNVFREDTLKTSFSPDKSLKNAPSRNGSLFKVPKVI
ncbi:MAG: Asp-tRNA(Asn)/Glu-tRNA(Gln) amidotransferase subunit GatC [Candidatus Omnitrophica bacterium]|nr:Asp-tRNA(Asn)/Glu-tRNA(Gln) amidotransferase subunit GatC [Candidatus Omnitrophota bacterium]